MDHSVHIPEMAKYSDLNSAPKESNSNVLNESYTISKCSLRNKDLSVIPEEIEATNCYISHTLECENILSADSTFSVNPQCSTPDYHIIKDLEIKESSVSDVDSEESLGILSSSVLDNAWDDLPRDVENASFKVSQLNITVYGKLHETLSRTFNVSQKIDSQEEIFSDTSPDNKDSSILPKYASTPKHETSYIDLPEKIENELYPNQFNLNCHLTEVTGPRSYDLNIKKNIENEAADDINYIEKPLNCTFPFEKENSKDCTISLVNNSICESQNQTILYEKTKPVLSTVFKQDDDSDRNRIQVPENSKSLCPIPLSENVSTRHISSKQRYSLGAALKKDAKKSRFENMRRSDKFEVSIPKHHIDNVRRHSAGCSDTVKSKIIQSTISPKKRTICRNSAANERKFASKSLASFSKVTPSDSSLKVESVSYKSKRSGLENEFRKSHGEFRKTVQTAWSCATSKCNEKRGRQSEIFNTRDVHCDYLQCKTNSVSSKAANLRKIRMADSVCSKTTASPQLNATFYLTTGESKKIRPKTADAHTFKKSRLQSKHQLKEGECSTEKLSDPNSDFRKLRVKPAVKQNLSKIPMIVSSRKSQGKY